jgi:hypothetical protein
VGLKDRIYQWAGQRFIERPASRMPVVDLAAALSASGDDVRGRLAKAGASPRNVARLRHIIGIERWGQRRLRTFLGEPPATDGHHPYKPTETEWGALLTEFASARADTVALAAELTTADERATVPHNQFGPFTARGWLRYLDRHARMEAKLMR